MNPAVKRFRAKYGAQADAIARQDIDQTEREMIAKALADAQTGQTDFHPVLFTLLATDPLCACAGPAADGSEACPHGREIRVAMHLSAAPDGRAKSWQPRKPEVRCISCGAVANGMVAATV